MFSLDVQQISPQEGHRSHRSHPCSDSSHAPVWYHSPLPCHHLQTSPVVRLGTSSLMSIMGVLHLHTLASSSRHGNRSMRSICMRVRDLPTSISFFHNYIHCSHFTQSPGGTPHDTSSGSEFFQQDPLADTQDNQSAADRKSTRLNSSHSGESRMPSSA